MRHSNFGDEITVYRSTKGLLYAIMEVFCALLGLAFAICLLGSIIYGNKGFVELLASFIS